MGATRPAPAAAPSAAHRRAGDTETISPRASGRRRATIVRIKRSAARHFPAGRARRGQISRPMKRDRPDRLGDRPLAPAAEGGEQSDERRALRQRRRTGAAPIRSDSTRSDPIRSDEIWAEAETITASSDSRATDRRKPSYRRRQNVIGVALVAARERLVGSQRRDGLGSSSPRLAALVVARLMSAGSSEPERGASRGCHSRATTGWLPAGSGCSSKTAKSSGLNTLFLLPTPLCSLMMRSAAATANQARVERAADASVADSAGRLVLARNINIFGQRSADSLRPPISRLAARKPRKVAVSIGLGEPI